MDALFADGVNAAGHQAYKEACDQEESTRLERQTQGIQSLRSSAVKTNCLARDLQSLSERTTM